MTPPKCPICSTAHYGWQAHTFATNKRLTERLTSTEDATNNATNRDSDRACVVVGGAPDQEPVGQSDVLVASPAVRTANRRDRAAYNAYQREYMRRKRAV
jgi:hypothetical protein